MTIGDGHLAIEAKRRAIIKRAATRNHLLEPPMYRGKDAGNCLLTRGE